jgi:hypothetical protein
MKIRVAIAEGNVFLMNAVKEKLSFFDDLEVVFTALDGEQLLTKLEKVRDIDFILMDIEMPVMNGIATPATPNACPTADGALWAIKSVTTREVGFGIPPVAITLGLGVGFFSSNGLSGNPMTRVNVGTVTLNGESTDYQGETYITIPDAQNASGISFGTGITWEITGDNGFGAFTHTH